MEKWRKYLDPEDLTPEETVERVVELLALELVRLVREEEAKKKESATGTAMEKADDNLSTPTIESNADLILKPPVKGRIPFGEKAGTERRETNQSEVHWIKRIHELSAQGFSSEKIAKQLNQEDHESKRAGKWSRTAVWRILKKGSGFPLSRE